MNKSKKELENNLNVLLMYCSYKEKESLYTILNSCTFVFNEIKKADAKGVEQVLEANNKKTGAIIDKFIKKFNL